MPREMEMKIIAHELRQLACLQRHKRHLVYRQRGHETEGCVWYGTGWAGYDNYIGELVRYYGSAGISVDDPVTRHITPYPEEALKDLVTF